MQHLHTLFTWMDGPGAPTVVRSVLAVAALIALGELYRLARPRLHLALRRRRRLDGLAHPTVLDEQRERLTLIRGEIRAGVRRCDLTPRIRPALFLDRGRMHDGPAV